MKKILYIVVAHRWGNSSNHSYTLGVFDDFILAKNCADSHTIYRAGKYSCTVEECILNEYDEDKKYTVKEVYKS